MKKKIKIFSNDNSSNIYLSNAWQLSGSVIFMSLLGYWLDKEYNTSPTWIIIFSLTGIITGLYNFIKDIILEEKRKKIAKETSEKENKTSL